MTWKKMIPGIMASAIFFSCAGCQQTPKEVQEEIDYKKQVSARMDTTAENGVGTEDDTGTAPEIQFGTIANIFRTAKKAMDKPYENLRFRKELVLVKPERCGKLKFRVVKGFDQEYKTLFPKYIGDTYDEKNINLKTNVIPKGPDYLDTKTGEQASIGENGFFAYRLDVPASAVTETILMVNGYDDQIVELKDGEIRLSEVAKRAQDIVDEFGSIVGNGNYSLFKVNILRNEETGKELLKFSFQAECWDIGLHSMTDPLGNSKFQEYFATEVYIDSVKTDEYHIIN